MQEEGNQKLRQNTGRWWCITIPRLAEKRSKVQEIRNKQFLQLTLHCDLDDRNPTCSHDSLGHDNLPLVQVGLHTVSFFERYLPGKGVTDGQTWFQYTYITIIIYLFIYLLKPYSFVNRRRSPQGFSLDQILQKFNTIQNMHSIQT